MLYDGIAALRQIGTEVASGGFERGDDFSIGDVPLVCRGLVLKNHEKTTADSIARAKPFDKANIAHVALAHRCIRLVGGIPPQLVQIGVDIRLAGERLELQPYRADFQKAGERVDDAALLPWGAQQEVDGLDLQNLDVAVICGVQDTVLDFLNREQIVERLSLNQLSVAVCFSMQDLCVVGQGAVIVVVDNAIPLADEPQVPVSVGFKIALRCGCDDTAALHKTEPVCYKLRQTVTADADHTENTQRYRHRNDDHQADVERQRQIKQRHRTAHGKHSRLHCIAQLDRTAENRAGVHKILRDQVNIPLFA